MNCLPPLCADFQDDAGQEPFEIEFKWTKLVMLPYSDISTDDTDFIVSAIGDEQDATWELKVCIQVSLHTSY